TPVEEGPALAAVKAPEVVNERPSAAPEVAPPKPADAPPAADFNPCEAMAEAHHACQKRCGVVRIVVRETCGSGPCLRANLNEREIAPPDDVAQDDRDAVAQSRSADAPKAAPRCRADVYIEWSPGTFNIYVRRMPPPEAVFNPDDWDGTTGEEPMPMRG